MNLLDKPEEQNRNTKAKKGRDVFPSPADPKCYRCHGDHQHKSCPFKNAICHYCKNSGHIRRACRKRSKETHRFKPPVNHIDDDNSDSDDYLASLEINKVGNKDNVIWVTPKIEGTPLRMELDTGSAVSVVPFQLYRAKFSHIKLQRSQTTLRTYTGGKLYPKGKINCRVSLDGQTRQLEVIESPGTALFGCD